MRRRLLLGPLLIGAVAGIYLLDERVWGRALASRVVLWLLALGALHEYTALLRRRIEVAPGLFLFGAVALVAVVTPSLLSGTPVPGVLLALAALLGTAIRLLGTAPARSAPVAFSEAVLLGGGILYCGGLLGFLDCILVESAARGFAVVGISKASDIFGFLVGSTLGRHRIAPAVSPKKTWEGSVAGILGSGGVAFLLRGPLGVAGSSALAIGMVLGAASLLGDLLESGLKRWAGAKDSGAIVPEFGGFLDLLDGILVAAPVAAFCLHGS